MNPEFQRNLHLELSFTRLIAMPLLLGTLFSLTYAIDNAATKSGHGHFATTATSAIALYILIVVLWGSKQAAENVFDEVRNRTWDLQKRTAISPWSLAWGKLFGGTVFNWYGGLFCWLVYVNATPNSEKVPLYSVILLAGGVLAQGLSMLFSVFALRKNQPVKSSFVYLLMIVALIGLLPFLRESGHSRISTVDWYGFHWHPAAFCALTLMLAACWVLVGLYRLFCEELQIRMLPWVWLLFLAFLVFYGLGIHTEFDREQPDIFRYLLHAALITLLMCAVLSYLQLLLDDNNPMLARRIRIHLQHRQWGRVGEEIPCWLINLAIALPVALGLSAAGKYLSPDLEIGTYILTGYLLLLRDTALILYFSYAPDPKRALGLSLLWLAMLYGILPWLFNQLHSDELAALVLPVLAANSLISILIAASQAALFGLFLVRRWQHSVKRMPSNG